MPRLLVIKQVHNAVGRITKLRTPPQVQEQVADSSMQPPAYMGEDKCIHTRLSVVRLISQIKNNGFEVDHTCINQNVFNTMGISMHDTTILLQEMCCMVGNPLLVHLCDEFSLVQYIDSGPWEGEEHLGVGVVGPVPNPDTMEDEERGSHGDPNQVDDGEPVTSD